ncbi:hypothetical protein HY251_13200 [bacterium]|nr:hypothetical protein [bacterium]
MARSARPLGALGCAALSALLALGCDEPARPKTASAPAPGSAREPLGDGAPPTSATPGAGEPAKTPVPAPAEVPSTPGPDVAKPIAKANAIAGEPFPLPDPMPECARPIACDVAPPPPTPVGERKDPAIIRVIGKPGTNPGELAYPMAIAAAKDGSVFYVVDKEGRIQKLDKDLHVRAVVRTPEIARGRPTGLSVAANGELWVSDTHYARVLVYSPDLVLERAWGAPGSRPGQFCFLRDTKETGDGRIITADYADDIARVQIWKGENEPLSTFGRFGIEAGNFQRPMKVAADTARGELYVADSVNHRIQVLSWDGKPLRLWGGLGSDPGRFKYPYDVLLDGDVVWVAEFGNHRIQAFTREGKPLAQWGRAGRGEGEIACPWGMALAPEGRLLVLDSLNDRIYELDRRAVLAAGGKG